jgi:TM2 domain-containing membrane protein YozV
LTKLENLSQIIAIQGLSFRSRTKRGTKGREMGSEAEFSMPQFQAHDAVAPQPEPSAVPQPQAAPPPQWASQAQAAASPQVAPPQAAPPQWASQPQAASPPGWAPQPQGAAVQYQGAQAQGAPQYQGPPQAYGPPPVQVIAAKNPGVGVILSIFIPGLGTIVNGDTARGAIILGLYIFGWILTIILIGFPILIGAWVWGLVDGYLSAQRWNTAHGVLA